jgi:WD40 repeat protein
VGAEYGRGKRQAELEDGEDADLEDGALRPTAHNSVLLATGSADCCAYVFDVGGPPGSGARVAEPPQAATCSCPPTHPPTPPPTQPANQPTTHRSPPREPALSRQPRAALPQRAGCPIPELLAEREAARGAGELVQRLHGHTDRVYAVDFHPHEPLLATCSADFTLKIWYPARRKANRKAGSHTARHESDPVR